MRESDLENMVYQRIRLTAHLLGRLHNDYMSRLSKGIGSISGRSAASTRSDRYQQRKEKSVHSTTCVMRLTKELTDAGGE